MGITYKCICDERGRHPQCKAYEHKDASQEAVKYFVKYIPSQGTNIYASKGGKKYPIAIMRWTDGLDNRVEKTVQHDARRLVAALNYCKHITLDELETETEQAVQADAWNPAKCYCEYAPGKYMCDYCKSFRTA